jgi:hypothetical protein
VRRISELKKSGVKVEAQTQKGSLLIPTGKVSGPVVPVKKDEPKPIDTRKFASPE